MNKQMRVFTASLIASLNLATSQVALASDGDLQLQVLETRKNLQQVNVLQEFNELFLDDWQKLVLEGKNTEAVEVAGQTELDCCETMNKEYHKKNQAFAYKVYRLSQHRTYLEKDERFSPSYFRLFQANPEKLIESHQKQIMALVKEREAHDSQIKRLQDKKTSPKQKTLLKEKLQANLDEYEFTRDRICSLTQDPVILKVLGVIESHVEKICQVIKQLKQEQATDEPILGEAKKIKEIEDEIYNLLSSSEWKDRKAFLSKQINRNSAGMLINEEDRKLNQLIISMDSFFSTPLSFASAAQEWLMTNSEDTLSQSDAAELNKYLMNIDNFHKDTEEQIEAENRKINFIKAHPDFFQIQARSRAELLGITDTEEWFVSNPSIKLGQGVIVGVIDTFDRCQQTSKILDKAVNPEFKGSGFVQQVNEGVAKNHGIHVAGIIVSDETDRNNYNGNHMTVGVAPGAQFEMIDFRTITLPSKFAMTHSENQWTVEKMAEAISELSRTGIIKELGVSTDMIKDHPSLQSAARILNYSMGSSSLKRFSRLSLNEFEGLQSLPIFIQLLKSKLLVQALGNDGIDVCSSSQYRLDKALALSPETAKNYIAVTNLMQDGITLNPSSNIPGNEDYMQARTLSAPGSEITSTILTASADSKAYEEMSGTSMAAPHVSGVAAVVLSNHPTMTTEELGNCLLDSAAPLLITENGQTLELLDCMAYELRAAFEDNEFAGSIKLKGKRINRADWLRGKACYGQGRVHLENALKLAKDRHVDLT